MSLKFKRNGSAFGVFHVLVEVSVVTRGILGHGRSNIQGVFDFSKNFALNRQLH